VRAQTGEALAKGAKAHIEARDFAMDRAGSPYLAPQILTRVDHTMGVMTEESFGPVVGIMKVASDEEAIELMNDSPYGLTASIWTGDVEAATRIGGQLRTGTVFMAPIISIRRSPGPASRTAGAARRCRASAMRR
jgi:acyl-CoA reductase-like NAD-dependent aldehyde dehydrogenase